MQKGMICLLLVGASCAAPVERSEAPGSGIDLASARLIDLSHSYDDTTIFWPTGPTGFDLKELARGVTEGGYFYSAYSFCTPEHGGTHLDAPIHFSETGRTAGEVPLRQLIAPAVVIDMSDQAAQDADALLSIQAVRDWEGKNGPVPEGAIVILRTGWSSRWAEGARAYLGDDTPGDASNLHFPGYGEEAARYLVEERKVGALGIDTASIDHGPSKDFVVHRIAAARNVIGLENVAALDQLPEKDFWILALPIKIGKGSGGPVRIVAAVPERQSP
ncbi:MAG: cyclase family protein [Vicinamibacteria bacterium]